MLLREKMNKSFRHTYIKEYWNVGCLAHIVQLCVIQAIKELKPHLSKLRGFISQVKNVAYRRTEFRRTLRYTESQFSDLPCSDTPTRWGSTFVMCDRCLKMRSAFDILSGNPTMGLGVYALSHEEWETISNFVFFSSILTKLPVQNQRRKR